MADDPNNPAPAGAPAGQPASGGTPPAADPNKDKAGDAERQGLRERAIAAERERDAANAKLKAADDAKLAEKGEFEKLAKSKEAEASEWKAKHDGVLRSHKIFVAGIKAGANDPEDLEPFLAKVDAADGAAITEALTTLQTSKPYLFGKSDGKSGAPFPTPAANPGGGKTEDLGKVAPQDLWRRSPEELAEYAKAHGALVNPSGFGGKS